MTATGVTLEPQLGNVVDAFFVRVHLEVGAVHEDAELCHLSQCLRGVFLGEVLLAPGRRRSAPDDDLASGMPVHFGRLIAAVELRTALDGQIVVAGKSNGGREDVDLERETRREHVADGNEKRAKLPTRSSEESV